MTAVEERQTAFEDNDKKPLGHGRMLRKEDPRFIRGKGRYVDDLQLPGMLHLAILRAPMAHARIVNVDTTVLMETPKLKPHKAAIREALAGALGIAPDRVNVKATTGEGMGFVGRQEGVAALAVATLTLPGE